MPKMILAAMKIAMTAIPQKSRDSDEKSIPSINFGGMRRYGRPSGRHHRHNNSFGHQHRSHHCRDKIHKQDNEQRGFEQMCFNCGSPACRISTCPEQKNQ